MVRIKTVTFALALALCVGTCAIASADQPPHSVRDLLKTERQLNDKCRGGSGDSPATQKACDQRDKVEAKLNALGWCYGNGDPMQIEANKKWQKCVRKR